MRINIHVSILVAGTIAFVGIGFFLVSIIQAASNYPSGYDWGEHFLSDLGRNVTEQGEPNSKSAVLFCRGILVLAGSLLPFFILAPQTLPRFKSFAIAAGVLSVCGLVGIGMTPYDHYWFLHNLSLGLWIGPMLMTMVAFTKDWIQQGRSPCLIMGVTGIVLVATVLYAIGFSHSGHVIFQKVLVLTAIAWILIVVFLISFSITQTVSARRLLIEEQAVDYMSKLKRGHRKRS